MSGAASLRRRRAALVAVIAAVFAAFAAAAPGCLPSIRFDAADAGDGGESGTSSGGTDGGDGSSATSDGAGDTGSTGTGDASATDAEAGAPSLVGPFANDDFEDYGQSGRCAVYSGALYCWGGIGSNLAGQLGFAPDSEDAGDYPLPTVVASTAEPVAQIAQIAMGGLHTCTLYGRTTYCRGANGDNELGNPAGQTGPTEVAVQGLPSSGLDAIAAAYESTCGITLIPDAGGVSNVYCWGTNGEGELGRPYGSQFSAIAAPVTGILDGGPTGAIPDAIAVAGGGNHHCALTSAHVILCWGGTEFYESGPLQGSTNCPGGNETTCTDQPQPVTLPSGEVAAAIALGDVHSCALATSGSVYCWGWGNANQLGNTTVTQICTDADQTTGPCTGTPVKVTGLSGIQLLRAGGAETCGLDQAHHAYCWGYNGDGELGVGNTAPLTAPAEVINALDEPYTFDDLAVGAEGVCARSGNTLYCWGNGVLGTEAADGATPDSTYPAAVQF
jgi:alpha-tubulin suppressor-like RCC1 family protein